MKMRTYRELRFAKSHAFDVVLNNPKAFSGFRFDDRWLERQRIVVGTLGVEACTRDRVVGFFSHGWKELNIVWESTRGRMDVL